MKVTTFAMSLATLALLTLNDRRAQAAFPPPPPKVSPAAGVLDLHVHSHPDVFGRNMDDIDVAQLAKSRGMRGIVLKNHISETASRAALVMKVVPGIEVFGGIVLNSAVGGVNPSAVEWVHRMYGGRGKVVWLPTFRVRQACEDILWAECQGPHGGAGRSSIARDGGNSENHRPRELLRCSPLVTCIPRRSSQWSARVANSACGTCSSRTA